MNAGQEKQKKKRHKLPLLLFAILLIGISFFFWDSTYQTSYAGVGALLGIPLALGGLLAYVTDVDAKTGGLGCFVWPTFALIALTGVAWLAFGEGAICVAMVLPIWIPAAIAGFSVSVWNSRIRSVEDDDGSRLHSFAWLLFPFLLLVAH